MGNPIYRNTIKKHPSLLYEERKMINSVKKGRKDKICEHCGKEIPIGIEHRVHIFADNESYPTHLECSIPFSASLL